jgi:hypothetical protein
MSAALAIERTAEASPGVTARIAGVFYLLTIVTGAFAVSVASGKLAANLITRRNEYEHSPNDRTKRGNVAKISGPVFPLSGTPESHAYTLIRRLVKIKGNSDLIPAFEAMKRVNRFGHKRPKGEGNTTTRGIPEVPEVVLELYPNPSLNCAWRRSA